MKQSAGAAARTYRSVYARSSILDIVVAIYDATIIDLLKAKDTRVGGRLDDELQLLQRASHRMLGLRSTLNQRLDAPLIQHLARFYLTASFQILAIPRRRDPAVAAERLITQMRAMRCAWRDVASRNTAPQTMRVDTAQAIDLNVLL